MLHILRRAEVSALTGLSPTRIHELECKGAFPARLRLSDRACGWKSDEIEEWIASRPRAAEVRPNVGSDPRRRGVGRHRGSPRKCESKPTTTASANTSEVAK